ncbi:hypothetical protein DH86_00002170 [Scytalidium sp. 3C]|nr:hypothetical protein DH86_00002170 [Scytalidium sp. 3C]
MDNGTTAQSPTSPVTSPPYWEPSHQRSSSNISVESMLPGAITLEDNTGDDDDKNQACWARSVYIKDYVVVNGSSTGIGSFVVWNITVETLRGGAIDIRKRYSEFDDLRHKLLQTFPTSAAALPPLPPKSMISKFRPKFLENRRAGLQYFLNFGIPSASFKFTRRKAIRIFNNEDTINVDWAVSIGLISEQANDIPDLVCTRFFFGHGGITEACAYPLPCLELDRFVELRFNPQKTVFYARFT